MTRASSFRGRCSLYLLMCSCLAERSGFLLWSVSAAVYSQLHPSSRLILCSLISLHSSRVEQMTTVVLRSKVSRSSLNTRESKVEFSSSSQVPILTFANVDVRTGSSARFTSQQEAVQGHPVGAHAYHPMGSLRSGFCKLAAESFHCAQQEKIEH